jgi:hypothetical protein
MGTVFVAAILNSSLEDISVSWSIDPFDKYLPHDSAVVKCFEIIYMKWI